eukprot:g47353.t1
MCFCGILSVFNSPKKHAIYGSLPLGRASPDTFHVSTRERKVSILIPWRLHLRELIVNLKAHMRVHSGDKPYKCPYCGRGFTRKCDTKHHELTHTGEKPYKCHLCTKCFRQSGQLTAHIRIHTGEKPYCCTQCERCFARKSDLLDHTRIHTGERPYKCEQCGKAFIQSGTYSAHLRTHIDPVTGLPMRSTKRQQGVYVRNKPQVLAAANPKPRPPHTLDAAVAPGTVARVPTLPAPAAAALVKQEPALPPLVKQEPAQFSASPAVQPTNSATLAPLLGKRNLDLSWQASQKSQPSLFTLEDASSFLASPDFLMGPRSLEAAADALSEKANAHKRVRRNSDVEHPSSRNPLFGSGLKGMSQAVASPAFSRFNDASDLSALMLGKEVSSLPLGSTTPVMDLCSLVTLNDGRTLGASPLLPGSKMLALSPVTDTNTLGVSPLPSSKMFPMSPESSFHMSLSAFPAAQTLTGVPLPPSFSPLDSPKRILGRSPLLTRNRTITQAAPSPTLSARAVFELPRTRHRSIGSPLASPLTTPWPSPPPAKGRSVKGPGPNDSCHYDKTTEETCPFTHSGHFDAPLGGKKARLKTERRKGKKGVNQKILIGWN